MTSPGVMRWPRTSLGMRMTGSRKRGCTNRLISSSVGVAQPPASSETVTGRRATQKVPFSDVSDDIESFLRRRTIETTLRELEEESQVVYFRVAESEQIQAFLKEHFPMPEISEELLAKAREVKKQAG